VQLHIFFDFVQPILKHSFGSIFFKEKTFNNNIHKKQNKKSLPPEKREKSLPPIIQPEKREKSLPPIIQPEKPLPPVQQTKKPSKLTAIPVKSTPSKKIKNKKKINKTKSKKSLKFNLHKLTNYFFKSIGRIIYAGDGIAKVKYLYKVKVGELIKIINRTKKKTKLLPAMALNLNADSVDIVIFGDAKYVSVGQLVFGTGNILNVPTGAQLLGRVVNGIGHAIDGKGIINVQKQNYSLVDIKAPGIIPRKSVHEPLLTGIKAIDSMIPIGKGQRELIIGDRQTGKTTIAIDTILNQQTISYHKSNEKVYCIYVAIGQKKSSIAHLVYLLKKKKSN